MDGTPPRRSAAITNAIAHNVIVIAASGTKPLAPDAPGCVRRDSVGASACTMVNRTEAAIPTEPRYVANYSNLGATIVAPGGDPTANTATTSDPDNLHWIENIYTSTPFDANFAGGCTTDFYSEANDCRIQIAGTSMSTPHVAGAAALVLSVNASYQSPSAMKTLLCSTADNISDVNQGCGRLNVNRAIAKALNDPVLP